MIIGRNAEDPGSGADVWCADVSPTFHCSTEALLTAGLVACLDTCHARGKKLYNMIVVPGSTTNRSGGVRHVCVPFLARRSILEGLSSAQLFAEHLSYQQRVVAIRKSCHTQSIVVMMAARNIRVVLHRRPVLRWNVSRKSRHCISCASPTRRACGSSLGHPSSQPAIHPSQRRR